jgi:four helix bundle protein
MALEYSDMIYEIAAQLPDGERFNLKSQMERAVTSIALNIAEGSTSQSDKEQHRFLGFAIRSLIETVACQHLIHRRNYLEKPELLRAAYRQSEQLFAQLQALRKALTVDQVAEQAEEYIVESQTPFQ